MKGTKLINLLKTFSSDEMKSFEKFIASPYFNSVKNYTKLLKELEKFYPEFDDDNLTNEFIFKKLYKGKPFNKQVMWNLVSGFEKLAEEFLIHENLENNPFYKYNLLLLNINSRNLKSYVRKKVDEFEKYSDKLRIGEDISTGIDYFDVKWRVETEKGIYITSTDKMSMLSEISNLRSGYLLCGFIQNLTQDVYNNFFSYKLYNTTFDPDIPLLVIQQLNLKKLIKELKDKKYGYAWVLEFYYYKLMLLLEKNNEEHFISYGKIFEANYKKFTNNENYNAFSTLTDYCLEKIAEKKLNYKRILFELNRFRLESNTFYSSSGAIRKILYTQILRTALSVGEIKWCEEFISKYTKFLVAEHQKSMGAFGRALIYFNLGKYEEILELLSTVEFIDIRDKIYSKILLLKSLYELNYWENLEYQIDSSKHFFRENKSINDELKKTYSIFINNINKITKLKNNDINEPAEVVLKNFPGDDNTIENEWLLEKAKEISSR